MSSSSIIIPKSLARDRAVRALVMQWINLHARLFICRKRVHWNNTSARLIERKRRKEQWVLIARIFEIERNLIRWMAKETRDPEIWMSKKEGADPSRLWDLHRQYYIQRAATHHVTKADRSKAVKNEQQIVSAIRGLKRRWMLALLHATFPNHTPIPSPIKLHPRELVPRKIRRASKTLLVEVPDIHHPQVVVPTERRLHVRATLARR